jgi:ABC-type multidrug transport system fused ATPase/permease subunit
MRTQFRQGLQSKPHTTMQMLYIVWGVVGKQLHWSLLGVGCLSTLTQLANALVPLALKGVVDAAGTRSTSAIALAVSVYVAIVFITRALAHTQVLSYVQVWQRIKQALALFVYQHVLDLPHSYHIHRKMGELTARINDGLSGIGSIVNGLVYGILPVIVQCGVIGIVIASIFHYEAIVILGMFSVLYWVVSHRAVARQQAARKSAIEEDTGASTIATDALINYETIKLLSGERITGHHLEAALGGAADKWKRFAAMQWFYDLIRTSLVIVALASLLFITSREVAEGKMTTGSLVMMVIYVWQIIVPIQQAGITARQLNQGSAYLGRMLELVMMPTEFREKSGIYTSPKESPFEVTIKDLWFGYEPGQTVLRGISMSVPPGRKVAIVGTSGAGKSTLLRLLCRLYDHEVGDILIDGMSIREYDVTWLRKSIAIVPQDTVLFNETLWANIAFARPDATDDEVHQAVAIAGLDPVLAALPDGWNTVVGERGLRLSGGEKQRVSIARAVLRRPRLFIFDEPTSSLDRNSERLLQESLTHVSQGMTTLIITHRLSMAKYADEIYVFHEGEIIEKGSHHALMSAGGHYSMMWDETYAPPSGRLRL